MCSERCVPRTPLSNIAMSELTDRDSEAHGSIRVLTFSERLMKKVGEEVRRDI